MKTKYWLIIFLLLARNAQGQGLDKQLLDSWHAERNTSLDGTMNAVSLSSYPVTLAVPLIQFIHGFANKKAKSLEYGLQTTTTIVVAGVVTYGLKYMVRRERPYVKYPQYTPYHYEDGWSFPSGHTSMAFATAANMSIEYPKWYVIVPSFLWAGAVGYSRIHLGEHYPSDVLAGAVIGAGSAYASYIVKQWLRKKWKTKEGKFLF